MAAELVKIEHLRKQYDDSNVILKDLSLTIHEGEVVVIVGPSGCGKSTLLRCINALEPIQGGSISYRGEKFDAKSRNITDIRQKIGMVFQSYELFPHKTILHNVTLAPIIVQKRDKQEAEKEAMELLDRVGLKEKHDSYPRQLSGGQKQRVAIVRSLIMHPEVARQGRTMVIVTHEMSFAKAVADRVIFIDKGEIVEEGSPAEFFEHPKTERARRFLNTFTFDKVEKE